MPYNHVQSLLPLHVASTLLAVLLAGIPGIMTALMISKPQPGVCGHLVKSTTRLSNP